MVTVGVPIITALPPARLPASNPSSPPGTTANPDDAPVERTADLTGLSPEGIVELPGGWQSPTAQLQLVSDLGTAVLYGDGTATKDLPHAEWKKSRIDTVVLGDPICPAGYFFANGVCRPDQCVGVTCVPTDQCHVAGTCDPRTGACSNPAAPDGTSCNDEDACTQSDSCESGTCIGANPVVCSAIDPCHAAGACDRNTGVCSNPPLPIPDVTGLDVDGPVDTLLFWDEIGGMAHYDVASGLLAELRGDGGTTGAICLAPDVQAPGVPDTRPDPGAGTGVYYMVRVHYACGSGSYGRASDGTPRSTPGACP